MTRVPVREAQWQATVIDAAQLLGWRVAHFRAAQTRTGSWVTPVAADGAGFPDLVLVRDRVVFVELKSQLGRLSDSQQEWLDSLAAAGVEAYVWRPSDWDDVQDVLKETR